MNRMKCKMNYKRSVLMVLVIVLFAGCANTQAPPEETPENSEKPQEAPGLFYSYEVEDYYTIYVSLPESYDLGSSQKYPVIYVLDADLFFDGSNPKISNGSVTDIVSRLTENGDMPEVIIVGIGYPREDHRERDFLYPNDSMCATSGGGDKFYRFLENELVPYVDAHFNTASERTLIGWEYGGYFTLYALFEYRLSNVLFTSFIAVSPVSDYHGDHLLYKEEMMNESVGGYLPVRLYMTTDDFHTYVNDMAERLNSRGYTGFQFRFKMYHVSVSVDSYRSDLYSTVCPAIEDGLRWIFSRDDAGLSIYFVQV